MVAWSFELLALGKLMEGTTMATQFFIAP